MAKFSKFKNDEECRIGDQIVGLRNGINSRFAFPASGIKDVNGNWVLKWSTEGALALNNIHFYNALTGAPVMIKAEGTDSNVSLEIYSDSDGDISLIAPQNGDINLTLGGNGDINFTTPTGYMVINSTSPIEEILDEDDMISNSDVALSTQQSIKAYVDSHISSTNFFIYTFVSTTGDLSATYNNGSSGVGATLTANSNGAANIDGVALSLGDIVLFKDQSSAFQNGIYSVTQIGDGSNPAIYTRYIYFDDNSEIKKGYLTFTLFGTQNAKKSYQLTTDVVTVGVDSLVYQQDTIPTLLSSVDMAVVRFDGTNGGQIQGSNVTISDTDVVSGVTQLNVDNIRIDSNTISSTNANGDIVFTPNGTGVVIVSSVLDMQNNIRLNGNDITSTGNITLSPDTGLEIDLDSDDVWIGKNLQHSGDADNKISFDVDTQDFITGNSSRLDLSNSGVRFGGAGARVTSISDDVTMVADSATLSVTQHAAKTYADSVGGGSVTLTNAGVAIGTESLVNDGAGPALAVKGVVGGANISVTSNATDATIAFSGTLPIANGGTNNTAIGASGTITQSDGTKLVSSTATYPSVATGAGTVLRADSTNWVASTATFADTYSVSNILYASSANAVTGLATANSASLVTNSTGVPSFTSSLTDGQVVIGYTGSSPVAANLTQGAGITITNGNGSISIANSDPASGVTLTSAGGAETLVNDGTGPALAVKGLGFGTEFNIGSSPTSIAIALNIPIAIATGGTNNTAIGATGTLAQSDGTKIAYTTATYPAVAGTAGTLLASNGTNIVNTSATYPGSTTVSQLLYSSSTNTVAGLATANSASLVTNSTGVPSWSSTMTNGQVIIGSTGATPTAATLTAGTGISINNGAGSITISSSGATLWTEVTGTSQSMAVNNGYIANNAALVTCTLPVTAAIGEFIIVNGKGAGLFKIGQNASQVIRTGTTDTTTGTGGSLTATNRYDCITLRCITANTDWVIESIKGAFTIA